MKVPRTSPATTDDTGMNVRVDGRALCSTSNSRWLDPQPDGWKVYDGRRDAAARLMLCWNACLGIPDEDLARIALRSLEGPPEGRPENKE